MRELWNGLLRAIWGGLAPIHRPLVRQFDAHMNRVLNERLSAELDARLVPTLSAALETTSQTVNRLDDLIAHTNRSTHETDLVLNTLLEEVIRLREQVELLYQLVPQPELEVDAESDSSASLSLMEEDDACDPFVAEPVEEQARVG